MKLLKICRDKKEKQIHSQMLHDLAGGFAHLSSEISKT
jgi:hypothetical protein